MRDSEIEQRVLRELRLAKDIDSHEICVVSVDGFVALAGTVTRDQNYRAAEAAARRAIGVTAVINKIRVRAQFETPRAPLVRADPFASRAQTA